MHVHHGATTPRHRTTRRIVFVTCLLLLAIAGMVPTGDRPAAAESAPPTEAGATDWTAISAGGAFTCGIRSTGRLYCWGDDTVGQLGNGAGGSSATPTEVAGRRTDWVAVEAGDNGACALRRSHRLFCWGLDNDGQVGDGAGLQTRLAPTQVAGSRTDWTAVSVGDHACARRASGRLFCWGSDSDGQLGNGDPVGDRPAPVPVAGGVTTWTSVSVGSLHTCARRTGGRLFCWGDDTRGQLGSGNPGDRTAPTEVVGALTTWTGPAAAGGSHTCARQTNGSDYCWGSDVFGQLGNGFPAGDSGVPIDPIGPFDTVVQTSAGAFHNCDRTQGGRVYCTGMNTSGQLGSTTPGGPSGVLTQVVGNRTNWASVTAGYTHTCALTTARRAFCWGANAVGQLGNGGMTPTSTPTEVSLPTA